MVLRRLLGALAATSFAVVLLAGAASATPKQDLVSGDERATVHDGNVTTCAKAGLPGTDVAPSAIEHEITENTYIDVLDVEGITAVVVKGGSQYNVYLAAGLGDSPWLDLHSPVNASDKPAEISHWFACVAKVEQPTETVTEPTSPAPTSQVAATTTITSAAPGGSGSSPDELASTGFGSPWLLGLGVALVAAGASLVFFLRRRTSV